MAIVPVGVAGALAVSITGTVQQALQLYQLGEDSGVNQVVRNTATNVLERYRNRGPSLRRGRQGVDALQEVNDAQLAEVVESPPKRQREDPPVPPNATARYRAGHRVKFYRRRRYRRRYRKY